MAAVSESKVFATLEEAKTAFDAMPEEKRKACDVFQVTDPGKKDKGGSARDVHVVERSHPLARAAAALHWGFSCTVAVAKARKKTDPQTRALNALSRLTPEERAAILAAVPASAASA